MINLKLSTLAQLWNNIVPTIIFIFDFTVATNNPITQTIIFRAQYIKVLRVIYRLLIM